MRAEHSDRLAVRQRKPAFTDSLTVVFLGWPEKHLFKTFERKGVNGKYIKEGCFSIVVQSLFGIWWIEVVRHHVVHGQLVISLPDHKKKRSGIWPERFTAIAVPV